MYLILSCYLLVELFKKKAFKSVVAHQETNQTRNICFLKVSITIFPIKRLHYQREYTLYMITYIHSNLQRNNNSSCCYKARL